MSSEEVVRNRDELSNGVLSKRRQSRSRSWPKKLVLRFQLRDEADLEALQSIVSRGDGVVNGLVLENVVHFNREDLLGDLIELVGSATYLEELNLAGAGLGSGGTAKLVKVLLTKKTRLKRLNLYNNGMGDDGMEWIARLLDENATIEELNLGNNIIGARFGAELAAAIGKNRTLKSLNLWNNSMGNFTAKLLADALRKNTNSLEHLDLFFNQISAHGGGAELAGVLGKNTGLRSVNLGRNEIGGEGGTRLARALATNKSSNLLELNLWGGAIGDEASQSLLRGILENKSLRLEVLNVSRNNMGPACGKLLAKILKACNLRDLNASRNDLEEGLRPIATELGRGKTSVQILNLSGNMDNKCNRLRPDTTADIGARFVSAMMVNKSLKKVDVTNNVFGQECELILSDLVDETNEQDRGNRIVEILFDKDPNDKDDLTKWKWTGRAYRLASQNTILFANCIDKAHEVLCEQGLDPALNLWCRPNLWQQQEKQPSMIHQVFNQKIGVHRFCKEVLDNEELGFPSQQHIVVQLLNSEDDNKRTLRSLALANEELAVRKWAAAYGTYLARYQVDEDSPPVHISKSCVVCFATDVVEESHAQVALKIMRRKDDFDRELTARGIDRKAIEQTHGSNKLVYSAEFTQTSYEGTLGILALHLDEQCLVFHRGTRSLFDVMNSERVAGNIPQIVEICRFLADAIEEVHKRGFVHCDIKPRNILRMTQESAAGFFNWSKGSSKQFSRDIWNQHDHEHEHPNHGGEMKRWKLIDLDASVKIDTIISSKYSSAYLAPELARDLYQGNPRPKSSTKADVWSFGVILYELLSGTPLFLTDRTSDNLVRIEDKLELCNFLVINEESLNRIEPREDNVDTDLEIWESAKDLVKRCLVSDPDKRLPIDYVRRHHFLNEDFHKQSGRSTGHSTATLGSTTTSTKNMATKKKSVRSKLPFKFKMFRDRSQKGLVRTNSSMKVRTSREFGRLRGDSYEVDESDPYKFVPLQFHFFFSHAQKEAGAIVKDLAMTAKNDGRCIPWLDVEAKNLTEKGMKDGIKCSKVFVFVLTSTVLFRPFCFKELLWAIQAGKKIQWVLEEDERFFRWTEIDKPWLSVREVEQILKDKPQWLSKQNKSVKELVQSFKLEKKRLEEKFKGGVEGLNEDEFVPFDEALEMIKLEFPKSRKEMIPYRRRKYESDGMFKHLLRTSEILCKDDIVEQDDRGQWVEIDRTAFARQKSNRSGDPESRNLLVVCNDTHQAKKLAKMILGAIESCPNRVYQGKEYTFTAKLDVGGGILRKKCDEVNNEEIVILLLTDSIFYKNAHLKTSLTNWWINQRNKVVPLYYEWSFGGEEEKATAYDPSGNKKAKSLFSRLFIDTEILPMREEHKHELNAMVEELKLRAVQSKSIE